MSSPAAAHSRLRSPRDIREVFDARTSAARGSVVAYAVRQDGGAPRLAVVAGRKVGGAVQRNRAKRRLRAAARTAGLPSGYDVVLIARPSTLTRPFSGLCDDIRRSLEQVCS